MTAPTMDSSKGASLLGDLRRFISDYVVLPSPEALDAVVLWVVHTHLIDAFESTPRLVLSSAEKQSGKTRLLEVLSELVLNPMHTSSSTSAAVFRSIADTPRTILLDEADTYFGQKPTASGEELRGLVNAGHRRSGTVHRCVGDPANMRVVEFRVFAPVAIAAIGDLPDTIIDRSVVLTMRRRAPLERVKPFRYREVSEPARELRDRLASWADAHLEDLRLARPAMPMGLEDRPADVWEPLLAIADAAGGAWPASARTAALALNEVRADRDASTGVQLLGDLHQVWGPTDQATSTDLVARLVALEESPWGDWYGKPIDQRWLAKYLRPYGVRPTKLRVGARTAQGYRRADLLDPWSRYLPSEAEHPEPRNTSLLSRSGSTPKGTAVPDVPDVLDVDAEAEAATTDLASNRARACHEGRHGVCPGGWRRSPDGEFLADSRCACPCHRGDTRHGSTPLRAGAGASLNGAKRSDRRWVDG